MDKSDATDAQLVGQTIAGMPQAFAQLYDRHARVVRAVLLGTSSDWNALEDMVQECFLRAYGNLPRLRDPQRFRAWICSIARRVARERKRSLRRDRHHFMGTELPEEISATEAPGHEWLEHKETLQSVRRVLSQLPEQERLAIHAFFLSEKNAGDAAELLNLSRSGVYAVLARAIARLAALLKSPSKRE